ncbi:MarR family transcriptional regulator [Candidatus Kaiserbacteria bacterium]|nr:MarR family transcriptional regulator [Candidatus Kaiserbacteria bacterium]
MRDEYIKSIIESIRKTKKQVSSCLSQLPKDLPISSPAEWVVIHTIFDEDGISTKELADRLDVTVSAVSQMIKNLEQAGLVKRVVDEQDKRLFHLHLSPHCQEQFGEMERIMATNMAKTFAPLSDSELKTLATLHKKISDGINT